MRIREKKCKSIISPSGLYGVDYSVNPYTGCTHGCTYCYATFMKNYTDHEESWGEFVDAKTNSRGILENDLLKKDKGSILISSVTDPYQQIEKEYKLTRKIIKRLSNTKFPVTILTKSNLVLRDLDILKKFRAPNISVGFTINFLQEKDRIIWEPNAPKISRRIEAIKKISKSGIDCYVHVGPFLEGITDLKEILSEVEEYISEFQIENLNFKNKKTKIMDLMEKNYPDLIKKYRKILRNPSVYKERLEERVDELRHFTSVPLKLFID